MQKTIPFCQLTTSLGSNPMNLEKLKRAEHFFMTRYPGGFSNPDMIAIGKKHKVEQITSFCQESFSKKKFRDTDDTLDNMFKVVSRSSMVSVFEKPKFKDFVKSLEPKHKNLIVSGLKEQLYGDERKGFEKVLEVMKIGKMAKWSLISVWPLYFRPQEEVFVKPTTAKKAITHFELKDLIYKPQPSWAFYEGFRSTINEMKTKVDPTLSPNNAAFTGFLMMSMTAMESTGY
jgi:hypothetical protein